jgi:hypothetical protein
MIRFKILFSFILLTLVTGGIGYYSHQSALSVVLERNADEALRRALSAAQLEIRTVEYTMASKAEFIGQRPDLIRAISADYSEEEEPVGQRHVKVHERLTRWAEEFVDYSDNAGKGKSDIDRPLRYRLPNYPDLYFAVDNKGIGLAAIGKDLFYWHNDDVSKRYPIIAEAMTKNDVRTTIMRFSYKSDEPGALYIVAIAPIRASALDMPMGAVVVGQLINDGLAKRAQRIAVGIPDGTPADDADAKALLREAPQVALYLDQAIIGSTFDSDKQPAAAKELLEVQGPHKEEGLEKAASLKLNKIPYRARVRALAGHHNEEPPVGVIALTNLEFATAPLKNPGNTTLFAAIIIALLGAVLLYVFLHLYLAEFEKIEQTIQEIIAGNKDAVFSTTSSNDLAAGFGQQLNLMSAFLQGKPMPDDDENVGGWGDVGAQKPAGGAQVQGVNLANLMGKKPEADKPDTDKPEDPS